MQSAVRWEKHRVQVDREGAERWLAEREWETVTFLSSAGKTGLVCDEVQGADLTLRRIWHTPVDLRRTPPSDSRSLDDALTIVLVVDGAMTVEIAGRERELQANNVLVWWGDHLEALHASSPVARIELTMSRPVVVPSMTPTVFTATGASMAPNALSSIANVILNAHGSPRTVVTDPLRRMLAATVELLVAENTMPTSGTRSPEELFQDSVSFIGTWAHSHTMTAGAVAEAMHVSRQYVTRVFAARGTSIGAEIRRHRVRLAQRLLTEGWMTPQEAAAASGFSSLRAMRRALRETRPEGDVLS